ncbi:UbiH/UbiF/VisC/COQ6 family ubiquinone biosynthesis hydroxylase [Woodsholea maritima]|uniref:UbiH/UbiF/VisC/COQ6 family ubiquinone biosynthesis hydroxylase n=1 Tax=Woodsholea maritima TaxID=240237 RepID=UPI00037C127C|nr:UbiH/UbiF/VisC/COQ6 family ubiquinone biosynthesis hydroxylase [Woodsholea maritima]
MSTHTSLQPDFEGDVVIAGGGLAGLTLALALHKAGLSVGVADGLPIDTQLEEIFDGRSSALAYTSFRMLDAVGAGVHLRPHTQRIEDILVVDGRPEDGVKAGGPGPFCLHFDRREIHPKDDGEPLGYMAENRHTRMALAKASEEAKLSVFAPDRALHMNAHASHADLHLASGKVLRAQVIIACDGKYSTLRDQAGIRTTGWSYGQSGLVCAVQHDQPHQGVAYEYFMPGGPFAILPLPGNRSSLVWTERTKAAEALQTMDIEPFHEALRARFGDFLGEVSLDSPRWCYPLGLKLAERFIDERLVLVGDAARAIHPIAGQGFNLGVRDGAALADILVEAKRTGLDLGSQPVLSRYERWRKTDSLALVAGTDLFTRLYSNDHSLIRLGRGLGMQMVDQIPLARRFFARTAGGETGDLPTLLRGEPLSV